jgi:hypothetical protein
MFIWGLGMGNSSLIYLIGKFMILQDSTGDSLCSDIAAHHSVLSRFDKSEHYHRVDKQNR